MENTHHLNPGHIRINPKKKWIRGVEEPVFMQGKFKAKAFWQFYLQY